MVQNTKLMNSSSEVTGCCIALVLLAVFYIIMVTITFTLYSIFFS